MLARFPKARGLTFCLLSHPIQSLTVPGPGQIQLDRLASKHHGVLYLCLPTQVTGVCSHRLYKTGAGVPAQAYAIRYGLSHFPRPTFISLSLGHCLT